MSFPCIHCGYANTLVTDSRPRKSVGRGNPWVRRQRKCPKCERAFPTREYAYQGPHRSSLTKDQVTRIRNLHNSGGYLNRELAQMFGVTQPTISRIINGRRWE